MTVQLETGFLAFRWAAKTQDKDNWGHSLVFRSTFKEGFVCVIAEAQGDNVLPQLCFYILTLGLKAGVCCDKWFTHCL